MEPECGQLPTGDGPAATAPSPIVSPDSREQPEEPLQEQPEPPVAQPSVSPVNTPEAAEGARQRSGPVGGAMAPGSFSLRPAYSVEPEPLRNLIVNYLPPIMDEEQLFQLFGQFGPIESVKIIYDKVTRESRGYGFVKYLYFFSATYAVQWLNGYHIAGKRLKVAFANAEAAMESYKAMSASAMMFTMQQQIAMQNIFRRQMLLAQQQQQLHSS